MAWTLKDIKKRIVYFENKLKREKNPNKRRELKETISSLNGVIEYFQEEYDYSLPSFNEVRTLDKNFITSYHKLFPYILNFADNFSEEEIDFITSLKKDKSINGQKIMTVTKDFYDSIKDTRFTKPFLDMYANHRFYVNFRPANKHNTKDNTAITFNIYNSPEIFLLVNYSKNINDYLALIHEYAHAISCRINRFYTVDFGKYLFNETDGIFFEMIANEELAKNEENEIDSLVIDLDRFFDYALNAVLVQAKVELYTTIDHNPKMRRSDMIKFLKVDQRLTKEDIQEVLHKEMYKLFNYAMSYLLAIELVLLYRIDAKKALDALYELISLSGKSSVEHLKMLKNKYGIVPGANTHVYFQELKARVEGMKNDKKVQYTIK